MRRSSLDCMLLAASLGTLLSGCGQSPAVPPQAKLAYISLPVSNAVSRISLATGRELNHIIVGSLPHNLQLSKDGSKLYVTLVGSQAVAELDVATGKLLRSILTEPVPRTRFDGSVIRGHVREHAFTATTCFACHNGNQGAATPTVVGSRPFGMHLSDDGKTLFVTNINSGNLSVIDLASGKLLKLIALSPDGDARQPTAIARLGDSLFITLLPILPSSSPAVLRRLDASDPEASRHTDTLLGSEAYFLLPDSGRHMVYVSNFETDTVTSLDADGRILHRFPVGMGPRGLLPLPDGKHVLVANYYDNSVSEIDLTDAEVQT
ncbi:MAG: YncE family protein, partial [Gammaproteobacteria bacterium]